MSAHILEVAYELIGSFLEESTNTYALVLLLKSPFNLLLLLALPHN